MRYKVTVQHGESGSIFYVVDSFAPEAEQPAIVSEWKLRELADLQARTLNSVVDSGGK